MLEQVLQVLDPFGKVTKTLSQRDESISSVLPSYNAIINLLKTNNDLVKTDIIINFKNTIKIGLETRMNEF